MKAMMSSHHGGAALFPPSPTRSGSVNDVDSGWEPIERAVRGPTRPWDDLRVLLGLDEAPAECRPTPTPSAVRGGTRSWDELLSLAPAIASMTPAVASAPESSSPTRGGTLTWDAALFSALLLTEAPIAPGKSAGDWFEDLGVETALEALLRAPPSSAARRKPELTQAAAWSRDEPRIEMSSDCDIDAGELSILLGDDD